MIIGVSEETKGYRVYLPRDRVVVTTQHVKNIATLDKTQNEQVQRMYLQEDNVTDVDESAENDTGAAEPVDTGNATTASRRKKKKKKKGCANKKPWKRKQHMTRSAPRKAAEETAEEADDSDQQEDHDVRVVINVMEVDPKNYREAMRSPRRDGWIRAMPGELDALESNGVWEIVRMPRDVHALYTKWVSSIRPSETLRGCSSVSRPDW
ncbi:unnamed protein product [Phytophthora fragariaefolia]|uniref:Unnamed protein product n=1 Tax=Phytophthora fragariaefolia TaxID=1490495 RepID=A0A9W6XUP6_9STRA|nr:unnamed protein product [Phytophthora fragariaefolia]